MSSPHRVEALPEGQEFRQDQTPSPPKKRSRAESIGPKINLNISVDLSHIFPEGLREPRFGTLLTMEKVDILTIGTMTAMCIGDVDDLKKAIQDLCWTTFDVNIRRRTYQMWLQTAPYNSPHYPYGQFSAVDYDTTWQELLDNYQLPYTTRELPLQGTPLWQYMVIPHGVPQHYKHVEFYYKKCPLLVAEEGGLLPLLVWAAPENSGLLPLHSEKEQQKKTVVWKSLRETANYTTFFDLHVHCLWFGDVLQQFSMSFWFSFSRIFDTSWHHLTRPTSLWFETSRASTLNLLVLLGDLCIHPLAMSSSNTVGPAEAPWDTPDPVTCIRHLQSLVGLGFNIGHDSAGDLQNLIQAAMGGIRKEGGPTHGLYGHRTCGTQDRSSASAQDGSILEVHGCYYPRESSLRSKWSITWIWSCLLSVEQDAEPSWMVDQESLAILWWMVVGG